MNKVLLHMQNLRQEKSDDFSNNIENYLISVMYPVKPNPEFINRLGNWLISPRDISIGRYRQSTPASSFVIGLLIVLVLVWIIRRLLRSKNTTC